MAENGTPIVIGSDHAAYALKEKIKAFLIERSIDVEDAGCYSEDSVDYPDVGIKVASMVSSGPSSPGVNGAIGPQR